MEISDFFYPESIGIFERDVGFGPIDLGSDYLLWIDSFLVGTSSTFSFLIGSE